MARNTYNNQYNFKRQPAEKTVIREKNSRKLIALLLIN